MHRYKKTHTHTCAETPDTHRHMHTDIYKCTGIHTQTHAYLITYTNTHAHRCACGKSK